MAHALLNGTNVQASDLFEYRRVVNGDGGEINGVELNYQHQLRFLPGFLSNLGILANYTYVDADIGYPGPGGTAAVSGPLTFLSKDSANGTLFYEDDRLSLRASVAYRSGYVTAFAGGARESSTEEGVNSALTVDASASYKLTQRTPYWRWLPLLGVGRRQVFLPDLYGIRRSVRHTYVST